MYYSSQLYNYLCTDNVDAHVRPPMNEYLPFNKCLFNLRIKTEQTLFI